MAGETTKFIADAIFSGLNEGLRGRRALKEEERLRNAALRDLQNRYALQDQRYNEVLLPREQQLYEQNRTRALIENEELYNRALKERDELRAYNNQVYQEDTLPRELEKEERLRNAALRDLQDRYALQDQRHKEVLWPRALEEDEILYNRNQVRLDNEREKNIDVARLLGRELNVPNYAYGAIAKQYGLESPFLASGSESKAIRGSRALRSGGSSKALLTDDSGGLDWPAKERLYKEIDRLRKELDLITYDTDEFGKKTKKKTINSTLVAALERQIEELGTKAYGLELTPEVQQDKEDFINEATKSEPSPTATPNALRPPAKPNASSPALIPQTLPQGEEMATTIYEDVANEIAVGLGSIKKGASTGLEKLKPVYNYMNEPTTKNEYEAMSFIEQVFVKLTGKKLPAKQLREFLKYTVLKVKDKPFLDINKRPRIDNWPYINIPNRALIDNDKIDISQPLLPNETIYLKRIK